MNYRIIYQLADQPVSVITPCDCGLTAEEIGQKDVPPGVPFWIVAAADVPTDRTFRDAWRLDSAAIGEPDGFGAAAILGGVL